MRHLPLLPAGLDLRVDARAGLEGRPTDGFQGNDERRERRFRARLGETRARLGPGVPGKPTHGGR